jgi:hypothetical protein
MLQAIGGGIDLLEHYHEYVPIADVLRCWCHGSVIRSWLVELMEQAYRDNGGLKAIPSYVEDTGEVDWLVDDALRMEVPVPVIAQSVMQLMASRDQDKNWARAIAMMRHGFGGHPYGSDERIVAERRGGRIGGFRHCPGAFGSRLRCRGRLQPVAVRPGGDLGRSLGRDGCPGHRPRPRLRRRSRDGARGCRGSPAQRAGTRR